MIYGHAMPSADRSSPEHAGLEIRWDQRFLRRSILMLIPLFLAYVAIAALASGTLRLIGVAGSILFGVVVLPSGGVSARQIRRTPVAAVLDEYGVTFRQHDPAAWEVFREVRFGRVKPRLLFAWRPLHYIAFVPQRPADLPPATPRERLAMRMYGTNLLLMTETVTPSADDILAAVERLSDVPIRR
jgi:hypothetical protein